MLDVNIFLNEQTFEDLISSEKLRLRNTKNAIKVRELLLMGKKLKEEIVAIRSVCLKTKARMERNALIDKATLLEEECVRIEWEARKYLRDKIGNVIIQHKHDFLLPSCGDNEEASPLNRSVISFESLLLSCVGGDVAELEWPALFLEIFEHQQPNNCFAKFLKIKSLPNNLRIEPCYYVNSDLLYFFYDSNQLLPDVIFSELFKLIVATFSPIAAHLTQFYLPPPRLELQARKSLSVLARMGNLEVCRISCLGDYLGRGNNIRYAKKSKLTRFYSNRRYMYTIQVRFYSSTLKRLFGSPPPPTLCLFSTNPSPQMSLRKALNLHSVSDQVVFCLAEDVLSTNSFLDAFKGKVGDNDWLFVRRFQLKLENVAQQFFTVRCVCVQYPGIFRWFKCLKANDFFDL